MVVSSKCKVNIYDRPYNVKQLSIDSLPLRTRVSSKKIYYDAPASRKCKSMHIIVDRFDQARQLRTFSLRETTRKETSTYYYLDIASRKVKKLKEVAGHTLDYNLVFHGTKTQAMKRLEKLL